MRAYQKLRAENQVANIITKPTMIKQFISNRNELMRSRTEVSQVVLIALAVLTILQMTMGTIVWERVNPVISTSIDVKVVLSEVKQVKIYWAQVSVSDALDWNQDIESKLLNADDKIVLLHEKLSRQCRTLWDNYINRLKTLTDRAPLKSMETFDNGSIRRTANINSRRKRQTVQINTLTVFSTVQKNSHFNIFTSSFFDCGIITLSLSRQQKLSI